MKVKGPRSVCVLEKYVKDNNHVRFHIYSKHCCRETHLDSRLHFITQTCACIMQRFLKTIKMIFLMKNLNIFFFLLKTLIVGTC